MLWSRSGQFLLNQPSAGLNDGWTVGAACAREEQDGTPRVAMVAHV
jgi:hypothetical protein